MEIETRRLRRHETQIFNTRRRGIVNLLIGCIFLPHFLAGLLFPESLPTLTKPVLVAAYLLPTTALYHLYRTRRNKLKWQGVFVAKPGDNLLQSKAMVWCLGLAATLIVVLLLSIVYSSKSAGETHLPIGSLFAGALLGVFSFILLGHALQVRDHASSAISLGSILLVPAFGFPIIPFEYSFIAVAGLLSAPFLILGLFRVLAPDIHVTP